MLVQGVLLLLGCRGCPHTCNSDGTHTLHSKEDLDTCVGARRSLPRRCLAWVPSDLAAREACGAACWHSTYPQSSHGASWALRGFVLLPPLPSSPLCLFLHYFSAPPTLSLPLLPSRGFCSFSPLPLPPPRSLPPSPIPAPAAQPVSIKYRSPVLYQWSAELTSPARCFSQ